MQFKSALIGRFLVLFGLWSSVYADAFDYFYNICDEPIQLNAAVLAQCPPASFYEDKEAFIKRRECLCTSEDYLRTVYQCLNTFAKKANNNKAVKGSWEQFQKSCERYDSKPKWTLDETRQNVQSNPITQSFEQANATATGSFNVPDEYFSENNVEGGLDYHFQRWAPQAYGQALLGIIFGVIFLQVVVNLLSWFTPAVIREAGNSPPARLFRKHLVLPALFHKRRARPITFLKHAHLCLPPRFHSFVIAGYWIASVVFCCYRYPVVLTEAISTSRPAYLGYFVGYRAGILGTFNIPLLWLFAGRNNFLIWATGWQFEIFNHYHRWIARLFTLEIIVHAASWTVYLKTSGYYTDQFKQKWFNWGLVALVMMCLLCFQGTKSLRAPAYDVFLAFHILFAVFVVVGMWYHLRYVQICEQQLYCVIAVWGFDRLARGVRICLANPLTSRAVICAHSDDVMELTVHYSQVWKPKGGTYVFIHFLDPFRFWQSHPFTVIAPAKEDESGTLKLYAKARGGITKALYDKAVKSEDLINYRIWLEGPYGVEFNTKPFKEVVLLAGGIGITAVYSHLIHHASNCDNQAFYVHWVIPNEKAIEWFRNELDVMRSLPNADISVHVSFSDSASSDRETFVEKMPQIFRPNSLGSRASLRFHQSRPDTIQLVQSHIQESQGPICFFVCGPHVMGDDVRYACANGLNLSRNYVQFYEETFTM